MLLLIGKIVKMLLLILIFLQYVLLVLRTTGPQRELVSGWCRKTLIVNYR